MEKTCQRCGKSYEAPPTKNQKYCSVQCAGNHRQRVSKTCAECGTAYTVPPSKVNRSRFCSRSCQGIFTGRRQTIAATETRICPVCDNEYQTTNHHGGRKTCSAECSNKWKGMQNSLRRSKKVKVKCAHCQKERRVFPSRIDGRTFFCNHKCKAAYRTETGTVELQCEICGKPYVTLQSLAYADDPARQSKYCSRECMGEATSLRMRGDNNPNWVGGREPTTWRGEDWGKQRRKAKRRDNYTCQRCQHRFSPHSRRLHVHHIVPFRLFVDDFVKANTLDNLICLCHACHSIVESATRNALADPSTETEDTNQLRLYLRPLISIQTEDSTAH